MPIMDGYSATAQIREKGINIPIIAITADVMESVKQRAIQVGINDIVTKPIKPSLLYDRISNWISGESNDGIIDDPEISGIDLSGVSSDIIDIVSGIKRFGGNQNLYFKMLNKFLASADETIIKLRDSINDKDPKKAYLIAHSLKGESGSIGAKSTYYHASIIEDCIKEKSCSPLLLDEISNLRISVDQLKQTIEDNKFGDDKIEDGKAKRLIKNIVVELIESLKLRSPNVFDLMDELENTEVESSVLLQISTAIRNDDNNSAIKLLNELS